MGYFKDLIVRIKGDSKPLTKETKKATGTVNKFGKNVKSAGAKMGSMFATLGVAIGAAFAVKALIKFGSESVRLYDTQIKALTKVNTAVKATGMAAGLTTEELAATASELQKITTFGDEDILNNVTAQLLTFTNIGQDQFKRTQVAALDLATMLDGDLKSASIQLGKALNDPVTNLSALSRSGIQFSDSQKETINRLAQTNQMAEAQTLILDELNKQYGGQAEAQAKVGLGPWKQITNEIGDMREEMGARLMPIINKFGVLVKKLLPQIRDGMARARASIRDVANGFIEVYNQSALLRTYLGLLKAGFKTTFAAIKLVIQQAVQPVKTFGKIIGAVLSGKFKEIPGIIKESFGKTVDNYKEFGAKAADNYAGAIKNARDNFIKPLKPTSTDITTTSAGYKKAGEAAADAFVEGEAERLERLEAEREANKLGDLKTEDRKLNKAKQERIGTVQAGMPISTITDPTLAGSSIPDITGEIDLFEANINRGDLILEGFKGTLSEFATEGGWGINAMAAGFDELGAAIGDAFTMGEEGGKSFAEAMGNIAKKVIKAFIAEGVASIIAKTLEGPTGLLGPLALPIAGAAGAAAAGLFSRLIPSFATGGFVSSPTLAMVGDNPSGRGEYIIPAEKLDGRGGKLSVEVSRRGTKYVLDEENNFLSRT